MLTLSEVFGLSMAEMFETQVALDPCLIVRKSETAAPREAYGLTYLPLSQAGHLFNLRPIRVTVSPDRTGNEHFRHEGEEWIYVLSGQITLSLAGEKYDLDTGDAVHFDSRLPHRVIARGRKAPEILLVASPLVAGTARGCHHVFTHQLESEPSLSSIADRQREGTLGSILILKRNAERRYHRTNHQSETTMTTLPPKTYHSADFDKTPPEPHVFMPDKLIHEGVEAAGKQGDYSKERKHPVFFVDLPSKTISLTIGWLDPEQSSNMHRHTYETILYVLEGEGYSQVQDEKIPWKEGDADLHPRLGLAQAHQHRHRPLPLSRLRKRALAAKHRRHRAAPGNRKTLHRQNPLIPTYSL